MRRFNIKTALSIFLTSLMLVVGYNSYAADYDSKEEAIQQTKSVSGKVLSELKIPMAGVLIQVQGTTLGAITDSEGSFTINKVTETSVLEASFVGYETITIVVGEKTTINFQMEVDALNVEEVVIVGFGSQKKVNLTGAVSTVDDEVFTSRPVTSTAQALQGVIPGLNISNSNGRSSSSESINIRGTGTIGNSSGSPLVLIDGIAGSLDALNPQDVESITVLKDAAASSIYGSRAPFGVILVTTKKGSTGKVTVNYNNSFRFSSPIRLPQSVDSYTYALGVNDGRMNAGLSVIFTDDHLSDLKTFQQESAAGLSNDERTVPAVYADPSNTANWGYYGSYGNTNVDWAETIFKTQVFSQEHNVSISGGNEKQQIYASMNYLDQDGLIRFGNENTSRFTTNLRATGEISEYVDYSYNVKFYRNDYIEPSYSKSDRSGLMSDVAHKWPCYPDYDSNGNVFEGNPINALLQRGDATDRDDVIQQQFILTVKPAKGWNINAEFNYKISNSEDHMDWQSLYYYNAKEEVMTSTTKADTYVYETGSSYNYFNPNIYSDYSFKIKDHSFKVMAGFQSEQQKERYIYAKRNGLLVDGMDVISVTTGLASDGVSSITPSVNGTRNSWSTAGVFGRFNYNYKEKYLVEANIRYDGSSRYRRETRWAAFPSFSIGWNLAKENFWSGSVADKISLFKIRGSYGELGNQNVNGYYPTYQTMGASSNSSSWIINGSKQNTSWDPSLISSTLTWETVVNSNIGLDIAALNNRLSITGEYYVRDTKNMVGPATELPDVLGTSEPSENNTSLRTSGWEASVKWQDRTDSGIGYSISAMIADNKTEITSYPNETNSRSTYAVGHLIGEQYGYVSLGLAKTQEEMDAHLATLPNGGQSTIYGGEWTDGDMMYADINGDGKISTGDGTYNDMGDLVYLGNNQARYQFGINLSADWKGFDASIFFQGVLKRKEAFNMWDQNFWGIGAGWVMQDCHTDYFRADADHPLGQNLDAYFGNPYWKIYKNQQSQTQYTQNTSYIRLKNVQLGYSFNQKVLQKLGLGYLRVYVSGENLWTGTQLIDVYDPETFYGSESWSGLNYPLQSTISFGISVNY